MRLAQRMDVLGSESAVTTGTRVRELQAVGRDIVQLHIGEPDFDTPAHVIEAAERAMQDGATHYSPPLGLPAFREAIAADTGERVGLAIDPGHVVVAPGAKPALTLALMALVGPGDDVLVPDPGFPIYPSMTRYLGGTPVPLPLRPEHDFRPDLDELRALVTPRTRLLVINSPNNPSGGVLTPADLEGMATVALEHDLVVLTDEIYGRLVHEGEPGSILQVEGMRERTVVVDGLSKTYAMTGWRLGWAIVPPALVEPMERLVINSYTCTAAFAQVAGVAALSGPQDAVEAMLAEFRARRDLVLEGLRRISGLETRTPPGAFYVFPDVSGSGLDGDTFAHRLLEEAGVSVLAGSGFGTVATDHVRLSYANSRPNLELALERLAAFVAASRATGLDVC
jgi:aspartate/methionine/tyrosine aminotransferase